jgi:hypothetical protein
LRGAAGGPGHDVPHTTLPRRPKRLSRRLTYGAAALAGHAGLLTALILGLDRSGPPAEPPAFEVSLIDLRRAQTAAPQATPAASKTVEARAPAPATAPAPPSGQPSATGERAPPAQSLSPTPNGKRASAENVRAALRSSSGCDSAEFVKLTPAEQARCDERNRAIRAKSTAVYPVITQEQRDFFDGACRRDDDWCLYRTGEGPYPGLRSLFKKKH